MSADPKVSAYLTRDAILGAEDIATEEIKVPEWGGTVAIRAMSGTERDKIEASVVGNGAGKKMNLANFRARVCAACIVDESGERMFGEADIAALGGKSAAALDRVFAAAQKLSGLSDEDVDDLAGNSEPGLNGSSTSV